MRKLTWFDFEHAVSFLIKEFSKVEEQKKPTIFHGIRVWSLLFYHWFPLNVCIAWVLHDIIEDTNITKNDLLERYEESIVEIVDACSENLLIPKGRRDEDVVKRCSSVSEEALIVKLIDIYDNFIFYKRKQNKKEVNRCRFIAKLITRYKKKEYNNRIFALLSYILE